MVRAFSTTCAAIAVALSISACDKLKAMAGGDAGTNADPQAESSGSLALLDGFEGEIDVSGKGERTSDPPVAVALLVKDGKIRADIPEQLAKAGAGPLGSNAKGYGIFDSSAKKLYVVLDASKQVIVIDLNKIGEQAKGLTPASRPERPAGAPSAPSEPPPKVTKTGHFDTVAGYKCENWDVASDHREASVCVAQQGFSWLSLPMTALNGVPTQHLWMAELLDGKHFPLRFVGYGADGAKETGRVEVTKVEKRALPAADFEYPPTYTLIDLAQMFHGFGGMGGMGGMPGGGPPHHR